MRQLIEAVTLEGQNVRVSARDPLPVDPKALAIAAAIRVFERYPALVRLTLSVGNDQLTVSREEVDRLPGNLPGLQGRPRLPRGGEVFELMQSSWSPTARVASGAAGMGTRAWGVRRRDLVGLALMATAVVLVARAIANVPLERWMPTERRAALAERF